MVSSKHKYFLKKYKEMLPSYETNAARVHEFSLAYPGQRALLTARIEAETKLVRKQKRLSSIAEIQARYNFTDEAAQKFLSSVERALRKPRNKDKKLSVKINATHPSKITAQASAKEAHLAAVLADIRRRFENEIRIKGEQTFVKEGFIYLVIHPSFEGWVKAGMTIDYEIRLASYNVADPLSRFKLFATKWVIDRRASEKLLLKRLGEVATEMRGEWALIDLTEAVTLFEAV